MRSQCGIPQSAATHLRSRPHLIVIVISGCLGRDYDYDYEQEMERATPHSAFRIPHSLQPCDNFILAACP